MLEENDESWNRIINGIEQSNIRFYRLSALVIYPKGRWKVITGALLAFYEALLFYLLIIGALSMYKNRNNLFSLIEIAHIYMIMLGVFINLNSFHISKRSVWYEMFAFCSSNFPEYECKRVKREADRLHLLSRDYMKLLSRVTITMLFFMISSMFIVVPVARVLLFEDESFGNDDGTSYYLPLPFWFPFINCRTVIGFIIAFSLLTAASVVLAIIFLVYISSIVFFLMEIVVQLQILSFGIGSLDERVISLYEKKQEKLWTLNDNSSPTENFDQSVIESLKESVQHHQIILKFIGIFQEFTALFFGLMLGINMLAIIAMMLAIAQVESLSKFEILKILFFFSAELVHIFIYTFIGSLIIEEGEKVQESLYKCQWIDFSERQKSIFKIFQMGCGPETTFKAAGVYRMGNDLFLQVLQTAYSTFNVLNSLS